MFHLYAEIIFALPLQNTYTYQVPIELSNEIKVGQRVLVSFRNKKQIGIIYKLSSILPHIDAKILSIDDVLEKESIVSTGQIQLAQWMADYYICGIGEALFKMYPKVKKIKDTYKIKKEEARIHCQLNEKQELIYKNILKQREKSHLIFGITGSGKTEIYIHLLYDIYKQKKGALLLVPEIGLTVQLIQRLKKVFGEELALLHSALPEKERFLAYRQVLRGEKKLVVGTRSAVFSPVRDLALIILDEEHDASFKENSTPRYDARQIALKRAQDNCACFVAGSATPRMEMMYMARNELYDNFVYHELKTRARDSSLAEVTLLGFTDQENIISLVLLNELEKNIQKKEQSILLLNRRGYFPQVYCVDSQCIESCPSCSVALTLHRSLQLICHYCGYQRKYEGVASDGGESLLIGTGTQKLEDFLVEHLPEANIERLDSDVLTRRSILEDTLLRFLNREIDILIGTQIIARGLDASHVSLVGVLQAEKGLFLPDFRASEKTFSLLTQVAGRAGRSEIKGRVFFECINPKNYVIEMASEQDYEKFYQVELPIRKASFYPPYSRLLRLLCRGPKQDRIQKYMKLLSKCLEKNFSQVLGIEQKYKILGPVPAPIEKTHNKFREHIIIKTNAFRKVRQILKNVLEEDHLPRHRDDYLEIDLDPVDIL